MKNIYFFFSLFLSNSFSFAQKADSIILKNAVLYYYTYGKGEPIILLSGGPGASSHQEDDLAIELSKNYSAILFDQRGTGRSWTKPFDSTTINFENAVDDIEILRKHLKIVKVNLSGHSWGGMLASGYASKYPDRVKSLILIGSGEIDLRYSAIIDSTINTRIQLSDSVAWNYWTDSVNIKREPVKQKYEIRKLRWYPMIYDRNKIELVCEQVSHGVYSNQMNEIMWKGLVDLKFNLNKKLKSYKGPVLVVFGWQDPIGLTTLPLFLKALPQAEIAGLNRCGHMPSVEVPEEFYATVNTFLSKYLRPY